MRTILITGFGRFPGSPVNPSGVVAARLAKRRRPALAGTRRVGHVFATRYDAVDGELPELLAREKPGIVVMFGVAGRSREVRVEECARNRIALLPDAGRKRPPMQTIALRRDAQRNPLLLARLVTAARATGVATTRSRNAGSYLCNYAYWRGLEAAAAPGGPDLVIFVHVPPVTIKPVPKKPLNGKPLNRKPLTGKPVRKRPGTAAKPGQRRRHAPGMDDLVRAGEAIVLAMTSLSSGRPGRVTEATDPIATVPAGDHLAAPSAPSRGQPPASGTAASPLAKFFQAVRRFGRQRAARG